MRDEGARRGSGRLGQYGHRMETGKYFDPFLLFILLKSRRLFAQDFLPKGENPVDRVRFGGVS